MKLQLPPVAAAWRRLTFLAWLAIVWCAPLAAAPAVRVQVNQRGDFALIGSPFGHEALVGTPEPVVGAVGAQGTNLNDSAPDTFWRSDSPTAGAAEANDSIAATQARTTAVLNLPEGAQVTHAYLYWSATLTAPGSDSMATLDRPGAGGFSATVTSVDTILGENNSYRAVGDITSLVQANGNGAYRVSDVEMRDWRNVSNPNLFGGWWMVVLYRLDSEPLRQLTIADGLDSVSGAGPQNFILSGFQVPAANINAKLGVVAMDGDNNTGGDSLAFNGSTLSDDQNPLINFFNSTRSYLGSPVSNVGDLPQLTGTPQSMGGLDLDVLDVSALLTSGQTSVPISASTFGDVYLLTTLITSVTTDRAKLTLSGHGTNVPSGELPPSVSNGTDFGSAPVPGGMVTETFTITNAGTKNLFITSVGSESPDFQVTGSGPNGTVTPGGSTTFQVSFIPIAGGPRTGTIVVNSNDIDVPSYCVAVQGLAKEAPVPSLRPDAVTVGVGGSRVYPLANDGPADVASTIVSVNNPQVAISADGRSLVLPAGFSGSVNYTTAAGKSGTVTAVGSAPAASTRVFSGLLYDSAGEAAGWTRLSLTLGGSGTVQLRTATSTGRASVKLPASVTSATTTTSLGALIATRNADGTIGVDLGGSTLTGVLRPTPVSMGAVRYHVALASTDAAFPGGGFLVLNLNSRGSTRVTGLMPDGRAFSSVAERTDNGTIVFFGKQTAGVNPPGFAIGELVAADLLLTDVTGEVSWNKPAQAPGAKGTHLGGASATLVANGSLFSGAIPLQGAGVLTLSGGNLASTESTAVNVTGGVPTLPTGSLRAWIGVRPATGRFTPRVLVPGVTRPVTGNGLFLPKSRTAWGYFPGTTVGGRIELAVP